MSASELDWLYSTQMFGIKLGLENVHRMLAAFTYRILPNVQQHWWHVIVSAVIATALWIVATLLFRFYVQHFGAFDRITGLRVEHTQEPAAIRCARRLRGCVTRQRRERCNEKANARRPIHRSRIEDRSALAS